MVVVEPSAIHTDERGRPLHRASPGRGRRSPSSTPTRSRRPWPPDEGRSAAGGTLDTLAAPGRAVTVRNLLLRFVSITAVAGIGLAAVGVALVPAVQGFGEAGRSDDADRPRSARPAQLRVRRRRVLLTTLQAEIDRQPVPWRRSQHTVDAVLAVEDADFYAHDGVNLRATVRALIRNVDEGETVQGGSTITQQVVKEELVGKRRPSTARPARPCSPGASRR